MHWNGFGTGTGMPRFEPRCGSASDGRSSLCTLGCTCSSQYFCWSSSEVLPVVKAAVAVIDWLGWQRHRFVNDLSGNWNWNMDDVCLGSHGVEVLLNDVPGSPSIKCLTYGT